MPTQVDAHCPYCSLNCGVRLEVSGGLVVGQARWKGSPLTAGAVCAKGAAAWEQVHHPDRLLRPLVRRAGRLVETDWDEALDVAAEGFLRLRDRYGPAVNAVLSGGSLTNEKAYLMGKLARLALATPHIDLNGRMCMTAAGAANTMAFGLDRAMTPLDELERAQVIVVVGSNLSSSFPVMVPKAIDRARRQGAAVVIVDPRAGRFVRDSDLHLALRPGTDAAVANGLLAEIDRLGLVDADFVGNRTVGFSEAIAAARAWTPERVEAVADVPADELRRAAVLIGSADRAMYLHARGPEQQVSGTTNVLALINVALACGHVGRPGCGIDMLTGQRNGQGGREWGQRCDQLPAGRSIDDPGDRAAVAAHWSIDPADLPGRGATYVEILQMAGRGEVKGLLSISTNMVVSAPDSGRVRGQLSALEHFVVVDPFLSESAELADVVLPGTTFAEEDGTITTIEGRVLHVGQAIGPVPRRGDLDIIRNLGRRFGRPADFAFHSGAEVFEEMRRVSAGAPIDYAGITLDRIDREGGVFWPCPGEDHPGTPQLYRERFAHPDGRARFHAVEPQPVPVGAGGEHPLVLTTGRVLAHYLSGNQTRRIESLRRVAPGPFVEVHPDTAAGYGLAPGCGVTLVSRQGRLTVPWVANDRLRRDTVFLPYHWDGCNVLTSAELDPISRIPGLKYTPVRLEPALTSGAEAVGPAVVAR